MYASGLHERLLSIVGQRSSRHVGDLTKTNHETVRRYLSGQAPSVEFLTALCKVFGINGDWLLTGRGPIKASDAKGEALREADAGELLTALSDAVERLIGRVDRLEVLIQSMEVRLRAVTPRIEATHDGTARATPLHHPGHDGVHPGKGARPDGVAGGHDGVGVKGAGGRGGGGGGGGSAGSVDESAQASIDRASSGGIPERVLKLREAFAKRSRPDDGRDARPDGA